MTPSEKIVQQLRQSLKARMGPENLDALERAAVGSICAEELEGKDLKPVEVGAHALLALIGAARELEQVRSMIEEQTRINIDAARGLSLGQLLMVDDPPECPCPTCDAEPGEPCKTSRGLPFLDGSTHATRLDPEAS